MNTITVGDKSELSENEKKAIHKIQKWVHMICRNKCSDTKQIYVSPYIYFNNKSERIEKTIICISDNLPDGPVIQVAKPLMDISLEDLLSCYSLINYCNQNKKKNEDA